jgi:hypothetical protein
LSDLVNHQGWNLILEATGDGYVMLSAYGYLTVTANLGGAGWTPVQ